MASIETPDGSASKPLPDFRYPTLTSPKPARSAPDSSRRYSLPQHFLPPSLWSANTSSASLVESVQEAARGEHILDEATVANRISALRQLNGATRSGHRYAKSTGARNSTFSQPVIVRTYSGAARPRSEQRDIVTVKKNTGVTSKSKSKMDAKLPPVEAFSFKGIMEEIKHGVSEDLERIAEICARSKYSLSNQYEVHMPPHGRGEMTLQTVIPPILSGSGPTLQAIGSDDEQPRHTGRVRGSRRGKSAAYGTLETIMSSSRSSDEDKSKKRPAAELAEEVRGRAAQKDLFSSSPKKVAEERVVEPEAAPERPTKHVRSRSATFATMMLDNTQHKGDMSLQLASPNLVSEPAQPQTSTVIELNNPPVFESSEPNTSGGFSSSRLPKSALIWNESTATTLKADSGTIPSLLDRLNSWLPWSKRNEKRNVSHAEGSLRDLLKSTETDRKGKGADRDG